MRYYYMAFAPGSGKYRLIHSPDFPQISSQGKDIQECMDMAIDCLRIMAEDYAKRGEKLPDPRDIASARE